MAEIIPDEGKDLILALFKGGTGPANTYLGLFTGLTPASVPVESALLSTYGAAAFGEAAFTSYARQTIAAASWGASGAKTMWGQTGRGTTAAQVSFPAAGAAYSVQVNGFFLANLSTHGTEIGYFYSNFDDSTGIASMAISDVVKVTPTFGLLG